MSDGETVSKNFTFTSKYSKPIFHNVKLLQCYHVDSRFCQVYECSNGVVVNGNSATAAFTSDDPGAMFKCKLNGRKIRQCKLALGLMYNIKKLLRIYKFLGTSPLQLEDLSSGTHKLDITPSCARKAKGKKQTITFTVA